MIEQELPECEWNITTIAKIRKLKNVFVLQQKYELAALLRSTEKTVLESKVLIDDSRLNEMLLSKSYLDDNDMNALRSILNNY